MKLRAIVVAATLVLCACGGGSRVVSNPTPASAMVSLTILIRNTASLARGQKYIAPGARSLAVAVTPSDPQYAPSGACVNIVAGVASYTLQFPAPIGNDTFTIQTFDNVCAGTSGTGRAIGATKPVAGTVTPGAANVLNPNGVAPAQPCNGSCTMTIGATYNAASTVLSASLSTTTPGLTTFAIDPGVTMALPIKFTLVDAAGNPLTSPDANGNPVPLLQPVTLTLTDTSSVPAQGTLGLALVNGNGYLYCPQVSGGSAQFASIATLSCTGNRTTAGTISVGGATAISTFVSTAPRSTDQFVIVYNGATQSRFQSATLVASTSTGVIGSIQLAAQAQVTTFRASGAPIVFAALPSGVVFGPDAVTQFISAGTQIFPYSISSGLGSGSSPLAGASFGAESVLPATTPSLYVVDTNCTGCDATHVGIERFGTSASTVNGQAPVQLAVQPGVSTLSLNQNGPLGVLALSPAQGGAAAYGSLVVAGNNSLYRVDLATATTISAITLLAGSGVAGSAGTGFKDNATGTAALFNFTGASFIGLSLNASATAILVADAANNALRQVALLGTNGVTTAALYPSSPAGLVADPTNGFVYTTHPSDNAIFAVRTGPSAVLFAGQRGVGGTQDGLGLQAYPLQFNPPNSVTAPGAGGIVAPPYAALFDSSGTVQIGPNTTQAAQASAGVAGYVATLFGPTGIAIDPTSSPSLGVKFSVVDRTSRELRSVF